MLCKFCGSKEHNNWKSWEYAYWRLYAILTYLFNEYYKKNKKINGRYVEMVGNYSHEWKMDVNWYFKPTQRDLEDPERMKIVEKIWRDTDVLKYLIANGDPFGVEKHNGISQFINLLGRGMEKLKIEEEYWNYYNYKVDLNEIFNRKENNYNYNKYSNKGLDDTDINYNNNNKNKNNDNNNENKNENENNNQNKGKKKRKHRKRKRKDMEEKCEQFINYKSKSAEPMDDGEEDISVDFNYEIKSNESENEDVDLLINDKSSKKENLEKDLNKKWKIWNDFGNKNKGDEKDKIPKKKEENYQVKHQKSLMDLNLKTKKN